MAALEDTPQDLQSVGWQGVVWLSGMVGQLVETYMTCFGKKNFKVVGGLVGCF